MGGGLVQLQSRYGIKGLVSRGKYDNVGKGGGLVQLQSRYGIKGLVS